eukprot:5425680-Amphidinium_carterae.2
MALCVEVLIDWYTAQIAVFFLGFHTRIQFSCDATRVYSNQQQSQYQEVRTCEMLKKKIWEHLCSSCVLKPGLTCTGCGKVLSVGHGCRARSGLSDELESQCRKMRLGTPYNHPFHCVAFSLRKKSRILVRAYANGRAASEQGQGG